MDGKAHHSSSRFSVKHHYFLNSKYSKHILDRKQKRMHPDAGTEEEADAPAFAKDRCPSSLFLHSTKHKPFVADRREVEHLSEWKNLKVTSRLL